MNIWRIKKYYPIGEPALYFVNWKDGYIATCHSLECALRIARQHTLAF
jgi:hypothetical protein